MNQKKPYKSDWTPSFLHEVSINATGKTYAITTGTWLSVQRRPGLIPGKYEFLYAERSQDGTLLLQVEGPIARDRRRRLIREADIKTVHIKTRRKD